MTQLLKDSIILCHLQVSPNSYKQCCLQPCSVFPEGEKKLISPRNVFWGEVEGGY